jgi:hypothetical protein
MHLFIISSRLRFIVLHELLFGSVFWLDMWIRRVLALCGNHIVELT